MTPEERGEKAASLKKSGAANCCHFLSLKGRDTAAYSANAPSAAATPSSQRRRRSDRTDRQIGSVV